MINGYIKNFIRIDEKEWEKPIYRIFKAQRLIDIFTKKNLTLLHPSEWHEDHDKDENAILKKGKCIIEGELYDFGSTFYNPVYALCWSWDMDDYLWKKFSQEKDEVYGICVRTTPKKLLKTLLDHVKKVEQVHFDDPEIVESNMKLQCFIGKVLYDMEKFFDNKGYGVITNHIDVLNSDGSGIAETLLHKREEFKCEKEIRLIYSKLESSQPNEKMLNIDVDPYDLFDEILLDSRQNTIKDNELIERFHVLGYDIKKINKSNVRLNENK